MACLIFMSSGAEQTILLIMMIYTTVTFARGCVSDMAQNFENFWKVKILEVLVLILILKTTHSKYWFWYWYWNLYLQIIDFDIDIELFGSFDIDIGIDIEKNEENIDNLGSEKNTSAPLTLRF